MYTNQKPISEKEWIDSVIKQMSGKITKNHSLKKSYVTSDFFENWSYFVEQAGRGFAYIGESIIIPSQHGDGKSPTQIEPPPDDNAKKYATQICQKYGYWYEGKGEEGGKGQGPEKTYCMKVLDIQQPKNNGSYDDYVVMNGYYAGVPTFSSVEANWGQNQPKIDFQNSSTIADALKSALANGAGTFAKGEQNIRLGNSEIEQIFNVVRKDFPNFESQQFQSNNKAEEFKQWLLQAEDKMWEQQGTALHALGDSAEKEREIQIVKVANQKKGIFFLGAGHFPRLTGVSWNPPVQNQANQLQNQFQPVNQNQAQ